MTFTRNNQRRRPPRKLDGRRKSRKGISQQDCGPAALFLQHKASPAYRRPGQVPTICLQPV